MKAFILLMLASVLSSVPALADPPSDHIASNKAFHALAKKHFGEDLQDAAMFPPQKGATVPPMADIVCHIPAATGFAEGATRIKKRIADFTNAFYGSGGKVTTLDISYLVVQQDDLTTNRRELVVAVVIPQATADKIKWGNPAKIDPAVHFKTKGIAAPFKPFWVLAR